MEEQIIRELEAIAGPNAVSTAAEDLLTYAYDATTQHYQPEAVVFPATADQIAAIMRTANQFGFAVVPRGAGSGYSGGALAVRGGVVLAMDQLNRILEIDGDNMVAVVEPGVVTADLHAAAQAQGLFYPPDPASMTFCTIGGNIAENAGGMRAVKYGVTRDYVMGLELVLPSGEVIQTGSKCIKDVVGYDLTPLFVGSEGTLGIVTKAILKLIPQPESFITLTACFETIGQAAQAVPAILRSRLVPTALEFIDHHCIRAVSRYLNINLPQAAKAFLLIDVDGAAAALPDAAKSIAAICTAQGALEIRTAATDAERGRMWEMRRSLTAALSAYPLRGEGEDIVVPRSRIPDIIAEIDTIVARYGLFAVNFGHAGDGNIHVSLAERQGPVSDADVAAASADILSATVRMGGRIAAEHGIGLLKKDKIGLNIGAAELDLMRTVKRQLDPNNVLNPGKIFSSDT